MPKVCIQRPNRSSKRHWDERSAGRVVAYARRDGADDALLIAYLFQAFDRRELSCLMFQVLNILNTSVFLGAIIGLLSGVLTIIKGLKLLATGKRTVLSALTSFLIAVVPKRFLGRLGVFLIWLGGVEAAGSGLLIFLTSIGNNLALFLLLDGVCSASTTPFPIKTEPLAVGDLPDTAIKVAETLKEAADAELKSR